MEEGAFSSGRIPDASMLQHIQVILTTHGGPTPY
uniref:Uncharacterized protein n=1 Tax=Anguilla anguilla TaxID=7936 RepID=A0A0E9VWX6_ANGAN